MRGLSLIAASGGHSSSRCAGLSLSWPLLLRSTGSRRAGSVVVAHRPSRSAACGIFPDQGSNPCPLHWQADSQPLRHQGSPLDLLKPLSWFILCIFQPGLAGLRRGEKIPQVFCSAAVSHMCLKYCNFWKYRGLALWFSCLRQVLKALSLGELEAQSWVHIVGFCCERGIYFPLHSVPLRQCLAFHL